MKFVQPELVERYDDWKRTAVEESRACCHNVLFEERVSAARLADLEAWLSLSKDSTSNFTDQLTLYFRETTFLIEVPHTFSSLNTKAHTIISPEQKMIRLESLDDLLSKTGVSIDQLSEHHEDQSKTSKDFLRWVFDQWNERADIRKNPVSFSAFKDELIDSVVDPDWPEKLRDRLGLAHYVGSSAPIPVALMEYTVEEVLNRPLSHPSRPVPFCVPTALDQPPYHQFFPTPVEMPFGAPMPLPEIASNDDLVAELLHPRLRYEPHNLAKIGVIRSAPPATALANMRNNQLFALRLEVERYDFGEEF